MNNPAPIPSYELNEWLNDLKPYQKNTIHSLISEFGEMEAAKNWLSANGSTNTEKFGGTKQSDATPFWDRFLEEFKLFVCGDKKYKEERKKIFTESKPAAFYITSSISGVIGAALGLAPALIVPAVAILLHTISKIGINAWCRCDT